MRVPCPQCGGEVPLQDTSGFVACPFCKSTLALDLSGVRVHLLYRPRQGQSAVLPLLRRFWDHHGLPGAPPASGAPPVYYPFWRYTAQGRPRLVPAWSTLEPRWREVAAPEGEQALYDPAALEGGRVVEASVAEGAARRRALGPDATEAGELVHIPFYEVRGAVRGQPLALSLEACSGRIYVDRLPPGARTGDGRDGLDPGLSLLPFAAMFLGAALVPAAWLALLVVGLIGGAVYRMGGPAEGRG